MLFSEQEANLTLFNNYQRRCVKFYFEEAAKEHIRKSVERTITDLFSSQLPASNKKVGDNLPSEIHSLEKMTEGLFPEIHKIGINFDDEENGFLVKENNE